MNGKLACAAVAAAALFGGPATASAATVVATENVALSSGQITGTNGPRYSANFFIHLTDPVTLATDDSFDLSINFDNTVHLTDPLHFRYVLLFGQPGPFDETTTMSFYNPTGPLQSATLRSGPQGNYAADIFGSYMSAPGDVSFTGLRFQSSDNSTLPAAGYTANYVLLTFDGIPIDGDHNGIPFAPQEPHGGMGAPEPAAWALMLLGFGAAGAAMRRRRALTALA